MMKTGVSVQIKSSITAWVEASLHGRQTDAREAHTDAREAHTDAREAHTDAREAHTDAREAHTDVSSI